MGYEAPSAFDLLEEAKWEMEGTRRATEEYRQAAAATDPHSLPSGQKLLREVIPKLSEEITLLQLQGADAIAKVGITPLWAWPIQLLAPKEMALVTIVRAVDGCLHGWGGDTTTTPSTAVRISLDIAAAVRDEIEFRRWVSEQVEANRVAKEEKDWEHRDVLAAFRARYPNADRRVWGTWRRKLALAREEWSKETSIHFGGALLHALVRAAPQHFEMQMRREGPRTTAHLALSEATEEMLMDIETRSAVSRPLLMPMIIPPIPWRYE